MVSGNPMVFLITAGELTLLPKMLQAASRFEAQPFDDEMQRLVEQYDIQPVFT